MDKPSGPDEPGPKPAQAPPTNEPNAEEAMGGPRTAEMPIVRLGPPTVDQVKLALRKVKDPELNLNIVDLGLVYEVAVDGSEVQIDMTLTSPGCPAGPQITGDVERAVKALPGVTAVNLTIVWQPFWTPDLIEPRVRAYMGL
jgi:metal-sulfur cluster biosynthetic enzyme